MIEILPLRLISQEDGLIFGTLAVQLGKLSRIGVPIGEGIAISPPDLKLKTVLEHFDYKNKEIFQQSLTLIKKEIDSIPIPEILKKETNRQKKFYLNSLPIDSVSKLWQKLLDIWLEEIKVRLFDKGFYHGISEGLSSQIVIFIKKLEGSGIVFFDPIQDENIIKVNIGKVHPQDLKKLDQIVKFSNSKLFMQYEYEWIIDLGVKITKILPFTQREIKSPQVIENVRKEEKKDVSKSSTKVFYDCSIFSTEGNNAQGFYIRGEKIFDLNKPKSSYENLISKLMETSAGINSTPVYFKLADISEGMGKVRGTFRLLHQQSLLNPILDALDFVRHKKGIMNVHIVIPFVRGVQEFLHIKRELAIKKLMRKNSLQIWMEAAVPENIVNLENYLTAGLDGVVLNLDELISHLNGFDHLEQELTFYKHEVEGLLKFLEDSLKLLHKFKVPFIAVGNLTLNPKVLEFLVEKGVYGIVLERYEVHSAYELLHQAERRIILKRTQ